MQCLSLLIKNDFVSFIYLQTRNLLIKTFLFLINIYTRNPFASIFLSLRQSVKT